MWTRRSLREEYTLGQVLGQGQFGIVYKARRKRDGAHAAVKSMDRRRANMSALQNEIKCMKRVGKNGHPNVLRLLDTFDSDARFMHLVIDYCSGGELANIVVNTSVTQREVLSLAAQLLSALDVCHSHGIVHRDVKLQNALLRAKYAIGKPCVVLVDFGTATVCCERFSGVNGVVGSGGFIAPEVYRGQYGTAADIFSAGVCLHILLIGSKPDGPFRQKLPRDIGAFLSSLLEQDPRHRPTARDAADHARALVSTSGELDVKLPAYVVEMVQDLARSSEVERVLAREVALAISPEEAKDFSFWANMQQALAKLDTNADGKVEYSELCAVLGRKDLAEALMQAFDVDNSRSLDVQEIFVAVLSSFLTKMGQRRSGGWGNPQELFQTLINAGIGKDSARRCVDRCSWKNAQQAQRPSTRNFFLEAMNPRKPEPQENVETSYLDAIRNFKRTFIRARKAKKMGRERRKLLSMRQRITHLGELYSRTTRKAEREVRRTLRELDYDFCL